MSRTYLVFLLGLFVQGAGLAILQTASNPYITILGPRESAAKRISVMGICNGIAGIIAPIILGSVILENADSIKNKLLTMNQAQQVAQLNVLANRVIIPYILMAVVLAILSVFIYYSGLPEVDTDLEDEDIAAANVHKNSIFQFPHLLIGAFTLFLYVGVEVIAGDTIINYGSFQGIALSTAKFFTSCTLTAMLTGYFIGIVCIPKYFTQELALKVAAVCGVIFAAVAIFTSGYISVLFIALLGLANSLMWPAIWPLAIADLGRFTKIGSSLMIMAIGGGAIMPLLYGRLADKFNPQHAYWIVIPCYIVIWYYATFGHKIRRESKIEQDADLAEHKVLY
jgi:glucose/galactose transporter